jgi:hypothetical protein
MATLTVGVGSGFEFSTLAAAIAASNNGDVIQVQAGTYTNDFATITTDLTIEGVGGMVNLVATVPPSNLQGILTIGTPGGTGPTVTLDNISFSGAAIPDYDGGNGAGIRYKSGNLTLNNTYFFDNQDGLLADADLSGTITINNSEFADNGNPDILSSGIEHNLYVGDIQQLTIDNSYFYDPIVGHDIKSRAANTLIENSRIDDPNGTGSYEIDLPNGGNAEIINNVIEKGQQTQNSNFIAFGEEGNLQAQSSLSVTGNTIIADNVADPNVVLNPTTIPASITGNTMYGLTADQISSGQVASPATNLLEPLSDAPPLDTSPPYLPCFAAGTRIMTADGFQPVEALHAGQYVVVAGSISDAPESPALQPIVWIGHRHIDLTRHACPALARPIRIVANAFADRIPSRDLLVSPAHAIAVNGVLIPARLLQNGATILPDERVRSVHYFHVELERHDILLAEGLPAESYLDTGNRRVFENADSPLDLHPDLYGGDQQARREALSCAPFAADAARVEPEWRRLAIRAAQMGYTINQPATITDPELHLEIDGRTCRPVSVSDQRHVFVVPQAAVSIRIVSRSTAPCDAAPWVDDRRQLGVAVERIVLSDSSGIRELPVDHPSLNDGWWPTEQEGTKLWRWTNGSAALSIPPPFARLTGSPSSCRLHSGMILAIHLAGGNTFLSAAEALRTSCEGHPLAA